MILQRSVAAVVVVVVVVAAAAVRVEGDGGTGGSAPRYYETVVPKDFDEHSQQETPYNFNYAVKDDTFSTDFGQQKSRDGEHTKGSYYVHLPDGRLQKVTYYVDGDSGFVAEVSYEGEARKHVAKGSMEASAPTKTYRRHESKESEESYVPARTSYRSSESKESEESYVPARTSYPRPESKESEESYVPARTSYPRHESKESEESYVPARTSYRSSESKESRESYAHSSVSYQSLESVESEEAAVHAAQPNRVRKDHKESFTYRSPSRPQGSSNTVQRLAATKPSRRRPKHSSEEAQTSPFSGLPLRPKKAHPPQEIFHSNESSSSFEDNRRVKDSEETLSAQTYLPQDSYEAPIYIPQYSRSNP